MNNSPSSKPRIKDLPQVLRRDFVLNAASLSIAPWLSQLAGAQNAAASDRFRILDTHVHFYDPTRPQGIPWPKSDDKLLYRRLLPADYVTALGGSQVDGVIVVEASSWLEDNQWLLDLADREPLIAGIVGHLNPDAPEFDNQLKRFATNPKFRGIRVGGGTVTKKLDDKVFLASMRTMADKGLTLDVIGNASMLAPVASLASKFPGLRMVLNHLAGPGDPAKGIPESWREGMRTAGAQKNIDCKVSGLVELAKSDEPGKSPTTLEYYRKLLDVVWEAMGPERLVYGSNWPVCERGAPLPAVQKLAMEFFSLQGRETMGKICWENGRAAYGISNQ